MNMNKFAKGYIALGALLLGGCGGGGNYSIIGRDEGTVQVTYRVRVAAGTSQSEAQTIADELKGRESKSVMVNFYDGERSVENMIYTCQDGTCYDAQPNR